LEVSPDGTGVVPLAGAVAVRLLAKRVGLLRRGAIGGVGPQRVTPVHDRGRVWVDVVTMLPRAGR